MTTNKKPTGDTSSHIVTDPNQIMNSTNTQPDYYTADLNRDKDSDEELTTTATSGLDEITDDVLGDIDKMEADYKDDLAQIDNPDDEDGLNTTTDTARFTDLGGIVDEKPGTSFDQNSVSANAGTPGHWGIDEDTA